MKNDKKLEETETIKYLFDHIKSVWTLSAGGLAFGVGILGFIAKETLAPARIYSVIEVAIAISLVLYIISVITGLKSHWDLMAAVFRSEYPSEKNQEQPAQDNSRRGRILKVKNQLYYSRLAFIFAGALLVIMTLFFIAYSTFFPKNKPADIEVTLKNVTVRTSDSRSIEVQDTSFKVLDLTVSSEGEKHYEIRDLTLKGSLLSSP